MSHMKKDEFSRDIIETCKTIGLNLKDIRIKRYEDTQETMAARLGVSLRTYSRMENGDPSVKMGFWLEAAKITHSMNQWQALFSTEDDLFDRFDEMNKKSMTRKRVRKT